jgi:hypothetical protein
LGGFVPGFLVFAALFGFASFPILPVMLELLTRNFASIPFHVSNTVMFVSSQLFTVFMQTIMAKVMDEFPSDGGLLTIVAIILMLISILIFIADIDKEVF